MENPQNLNTELQTKNKTEKQCTIQCKLPYF